VTSSASVLDRPTEIYRPFSSSESAVLRGFVENVRRLALMRFFEEVPQQATQTIGANGLGSEMEEPDDEAVRSAITQFRQIYSHGEPHSFNKAINTLKKSAHGHGGPHRDEAIELLDGHLQAGKAALKGGIGLGIVFETPDGQRPIDPETILDAYFHGYYLHSGNEKSDLTRRLDELQPWPRYTLYTVMLQLRNVYWMAANAVDRVLVVPELLDADVT
jgi:hypothetical protein